MIGVLCECFHVIGLLLAKSVDSDQTPRCAASELDLHRLHTVKTLKIGTARLTTVVVLHIKQFDFTMQ